MHLILVVASRTRRQHPRTPCPGVRGHHPALAVLHVGGPGRVGGGPPPQAPPAPRRRRRSGRSTASGARDATPPPRDPARGPGRSDLRHRRRGHRGPGCRAAASPSTTTPTRRTSTPGCSASTATCGPRTSAPPTAPGSTPCASASGPGSRRATSSRSAAPCSRWGSEMTLLRSGSATDTGLVRSVNQDLAVETATLFAVADGMGGHAGGEVAAASGRRRPGRRLRPAAHRRRPVRGGDRGQPVVWQHSLDNPELRGMGTTLTAVALVNEDGQDVLALVNVGDSRSYRFHDGELTQITTDHSLAEEMVRSGELTSAEAAVHPHRHILTRALGVSDGRGRRPVADPAGAGRPLPAVQRRPDQRARRRPDQRGPVLGAPIPRRPPTCWCRRPAPTGAATTSPRWWSTWWSARTATTRRPAVAAVAADFTVPADPRREASPPGRGRGAVPGRRWPTSPVPSRRERRRARRRERRLARGRRLITFRTLLFVILLAAVLVGAFAAVRWYDINSYFVRVDEQRAGHLPGTDRRVPLVPPGGGRAHRRHHRRRARHLPRSPQRPAWRRPRWPTPAPM